MWHDSFCYVTRLIRTSRNSVTGGACVTRFIYRCDITHPSMWHDSSIYVTRLIHLCDTTHPSMWHDSSIDKIRLIHRHVATWRIHPSYMTHPCMWHDPCARAGIQCKTATEQRACAHIRPPPRVPSTPRLFGIYVSYFTHVIVLIYLDVSSGMWGSTHTLTLR